MLAALDGSLSKLCSRCANGIPRSTLKDHISARVENGTNPGPRPYLTKDEETDLVHHLFTAAKLGYGKT